MPNIRSISFDAIIVGGGGSCEKELKRKFSKGDFVFKIVSKCPSCQGQVIITKIFSDTLIQ